MAPMNLLIVALAALVAWGPPQNSATGSVSGTIRLPAGGPAAGVRVAAMAVPGVAVRPNEASVFVSITQTDPDGRYRLADIPPGRYYITTGLVAAPTYYPGTAIVESATVMTIAAGTTLTGYDFVALPLTAPASFSSSPRVGIRIQIAGSIVTDDGSPFPNASLQVNSRVGTATSGTSVRPGGRFLLTMIPDEDNQIFISGLPPGHQLKSIALGNTNFGLSPVKVDRTTPKDITLTITSVPFSSLRTVKVSGKVVNIAPEWKDVNPVIRLTGTSQGTSIIEGYLNPDRTFVFYGLPAGTYNAALAGLPAGTSLFPSFTVALADVSDVTIDLRDNPFPEYPGSAFSPVFDSNRFVTLSGVVTQAVTQIRPPAPPRYFRMDVKDQATGAVTPWAVIFTRSAELVKANVGDTVTVTGVGSRDGTTRMSLDGGARGASSFNGIPLSGPQIP